MIIPRFKLSQTADTVTLDITAKYVKFSDVEFLIEGEKVFFYCSPYHLKLCLPGSLEDELVHSRYDVETGLFTFVMKKTELGEHFNNLEMITRLLVPREEKPSDGVMIIDDGEDVSWEDTEVSSHAYGFAMRGTHQFHRIVEYYSDVLKVDPRKHNVEERKKLQLLEEQSKFSISHYEADFGDEELIMHDIMNVPSPWSTSSPHQEFDNNELDFLKNLPNKNYNLSHEQTTYCFTSLMDILYAYCYDCRVTGFEEHSESGWTITNLAASLCFLVSFSNVKEAMISAFRRSLIFPLHRNFNLCNQVLEDLKALLGLGKVVIVKSLIKIYNIFLEGDCHRFILNDIFIKDYIIYISKCKSKVLKDIVNSVTALKITKEDLKLDLINIERSFLNRVLNNLDSDDDSEIIEIDEEFKELFKGKLEALESECAPKAPVLANKLSSIVLDVNCDS